MEDSWEICPYCQKTGFAGPGPSKTRVDNPSAAAAGDRPAVAAPARKTVLLAQKNKPAVVGWLVALDGQHKGEDFRIRDGQNTIGSENGCDVLLTDSTISGRHASLRYKEGHFTFTDLDSTNGSYLNDRTDPVAREELVDNDIIRLGDVRLKFKCF